MSAKATLRRAASSAAPAPASTDIITTCRKVFAALYASYRRQLSDPSRCGVRAK